MEILAEYWDRPRAARKEEHQGRQPGTAAQVTRSVGRRCSKRLPVMA
ncbi:hypothetical protein ACU4GD_27950 [Cupriavidus basilensis]